MSEELLKEALERIEADWCQIDGEWGPTKGGLEGAISRGEETFIPKLRAAIDAPDVNPTDWIKTFDDLLEDYAMARVETTLWNVAHIQPEGGIRMTRPRLKALVEHLELHQPAPSAWMPIETAPKNMDCIDIWSSRLGRVPDCSWNQTTYGRKIGFVYQSGYDCDGPVFELVPDPTHWIPLPKAP